MRHIIFDMETDGLLPTLTKIHSLVLRDLETDEVYSCTDDGDPAVYHTIAQGLTLLKRAKTIIGHNVVQFDIPAIQKVYPNWTPNGLVRDTLLLAALRWAHIADSDFARFRKGRLPGNLIGSHKLEAWGYRLGILKGEFHKQTDWASWSPEMQTYCEQDTAVTRALYQRVLAAGVSDRAVEIEHKLADYLFHQEQNGWPFDVEKALQLHGQLVARRHELEQALQHAFDPWFVSQGEFIPKRDNRKRGIASGVPYTKLKLIEFNPKSRDHIANRLQKLYGWKPEEFTEGGKPKVDENALRGMEYPPVAALREYLLVQKRLDQLAEGDQAWLNCLDRNAPRGGSLTGVPHIHGRVLQNRAVTHRAAHAHPNIAQVPKVGSPYGAECRALFRVPPGDWALVGADASGLELRCLAHYMAKYDDGEYGKAVLSEKPNDVHTLNAKILGVSRDTAKTFIYAFLYGAGDEKLGKILAPGLSPKEHEQIGKATRRKFLKHLPALAYLVDAVKSTARKRGYVHLIDGRRCYIRSEHAALNSLLQGTGAIICKRWIVEYDGRLVSQLGPQGWQGQWAALGWIHDEVQLAGRSAVAETVSSVLVDSIRHITSVFEFRVPLDGEAKIGANWKETH